MIKDHNIELGYDNFTMNEVLKMVIPIDEIDEKLIPSGFESIGSIAHVNLNEKLYPYKYIIGQLIIDKNPKIEKVINKLG